MAIQKKQRKKQLKLGIKGPKMTDFRKIRTQTDLEALFQKTNFVEDDHYSELRIEDPDENGEQFVYIPECCYMGSMVPQDFENSGYDALFLQTIVGLLKAGRLKVV